MKQMQLIAKYLRMFAVVLLAGALAGCSTRTSAEPVVAPAGGTNLQSFQVKGVVKELKPDGKTVVIRHEAIPNHMPAMVMPFEVRDTNELRGLKAEDVITFRMIESGKDAWIDRIAKVTGPRPGELPSRTSVRVARDVDPLSVGDALPEYHFTNELNQAVTTKQFHGGALVFTFIFTRCPYPAFCPLLSSNFKEVQEKMLATSNAPTNWHLMTISFDTEYDTPPVLEAYAKLYKYDPKHWNFVTGDLMEIDAIGDQFGEYFGKDETGAVSHNVRTVVIDASGKVQKIYPNNKWTTDELVSEITKAAAVK